MIDRPTPVPALSPQQLQAQLAGSATITERTGPDDRASCGPGQGARCTQYTGHGTAARFRAQCRRPTTAAVGRSISGPEDPVFRAHGDQCPGPGTFGSPAAAGRISGCRTLADCSATAAGRIHPRCHPSTDSKSTGFIDRRIRIAEPGPSRRPGGACCADQHSGSGCNTARSSGGGSSRRSGSGGRRQRAGTPVLCPPASSRSRPCGRHDAIG